MLNKERLDKLLNQPMTRREFLRNIGLLALSILGLGSALSILATGNSHHGFMNTPKADHDFGHGRFGA